MPRILNGAKVLYQLQQGESWIVYGGMVLVVSPGKPPKLIDEEGNITKVALGSTIVVGMGPRYSVEGED